MEAAKEQVDEEKEFDDTVDAIGTKSEFEGNVSRVLFELALIYPCNEL